MLSFYLTFSDVCRKAFPKEGNAHPTTLSPKFAGPRPRRFVSSTKQIPASTSLAFFAFHKSRKLQKLISSVTRKLLKGPPIMKLGIASLTFPFDLSLRVAVSWEDESRAQEFFLFFFPFCPKCCSFFPLLPQVLLFLRIFFLCSSIRGG